MGDGRAKWASRGDGKERRKENRLGIIGMGLGDFELGLMQMGFMTKGK